MSVKPRKFVSHISNMTRTYYLTSVYDGEDAA